MRFRTQRLYWAQTPAVGDMAVEELAASNYSGLKGVAHHRNHIGFEVFEIFPVANGVAHYPSACEVFEVLPVAMIAAHYPSASEVFEIFPVAKLVADYRAASGLFESFVAAKIGSHYYLASEVVEVFLAVMIVIHHYAALTAFFDLIGGVLFGEDF